MSPLPLSFGENWLVCPIHVCGGARGWVLISLKVRLPWHFINNTYQLVLRNAAKENVSLGTSRELRGNAFQGDKVKGPNKPEERAMHQRRRWLDLILGPLLHLWAWMLTSPFTWHRGGNYWCHVSSEAAGQTSRER